MLNNFCWNLQKRLLTNEIHSQVAANTGLRVPLSTEDDSAVVENNPDLPKRAIMQLSE